MGARWGCVGIKNVAGQLLYHLMLGAGDGFVTDQSVIAKSGVSDATAFFNDILTKPYLQQFIIGPHIYCADVSGSSFATTGQALYSKLSITFGYLNLRGGQPSFYFSQESDNSEGLSLGLCAPMNEQPSQAC